MSDSSGESLLRFPGLHGNELAVAALGNPSAPRVVLAHGGGQTRHAWRNTGQRLAEAGYHALAVDLPGHGDSDRYRDGEYTNARMGADLHAMCEQIGGPIAWVGASLGGLLALTLQHRHQSLSALVLVDIAPHMEAEGVDRVLNFMRGRPDGFASVDEAADYVAGYLPHRPRPDSHDGLRKNLRQREDGRWVWHWDPRLMDSSLQNQRMTQKDFEAAARSLRIPAMLVRGQWSDVISETGARAFQKMAPGAEYVDVRGATHMVAGDVNDVFSDTVIDFLQRRFPADQHKVKAGTR